MSKPIDAEDTAVIRMVARREIDSRVKSKSFILITVISLVILVGLSAVAKLTSGSQKTLYVGVLANNTSLDAPLQVASKELGISFKTVVVDSDSEGRHEVDTGAINAFLIGDSPKLTAVVKSTSTMNSIFY